MVINWLKKLVKRHNPAPEFNLHDPANWESNLSPLTHTGHQVGPQQALGLMSVYSAVRLMAETAASLPLHVYRRTDQGREKATDRPIYRVLHDTPNPDMTSFGLRELWSTQLLLNGNAFGLIIRDFSRQVVRIDWLDATRMQRDPSGRWYWFRQESGDRITYEIGEVIHIRGPGSIDGIWGMSVIAYARNTIWSGLAAGAFGGNFFANAARPGLAIELPEGVEMTEDERREFKAAFRGSHAGLDNVGKTVLVPGGAKIKTITIPAKEAQYLELMNFNVEEIARAFRLPPAMLGAMNNAIKANIEEQGIDFVRHSMRPWLVRIEQELNRKLFRGSGFYVEHNLDGLMRGNFKSRFEGYAIAKLNGIYTTNMILAMENKDSIGAKGDIFTVQMQMKPLEALEREVKDAKNPPKPPPPPPPAPVPVPAADDDDQVAQAFSRSILERLEHKEKRSFTQGKKSKNTSKWLDKFLQDHGKYVADELRGLMTALGKVDPAYVEAAVSKRLGSLQVLFSDGSESSPQETWSIQEIRGLT